MSYRRKKSIIFLLIFFDDLSTIVIIWISDAASWASPFLKKLFTTFQTYLVGPELLYLAL